MITTIWPGIFSSSVAIKQIQQAMVVLGNKDCNSRFVCRKMKGPIHLKTASQRSKNLADFFPSQREFVQFPLYPLEKHPLQEVNMLVRVDDIASMLINEVADSGGQTFLIWTVD